MAVFGSRAGSTIGTHRTRGFTLLEVMIVVAIVAILAAIALPNYSDYIKRGKIIEATTGLSDMRTRLEQYFLDNRIYDNAGACGVDPAVAEANIKSFTIACAIVGTGYLVTATGNPAQGMDTGFVYTIDQSSAKVSHGPSGWNGNGSCWAIRRDGSCS